MNERIKAIRVAAGLTQAAFGERLGVNKTRSPGWNQVIVSRQINSSCPSVANLGFPAAG